MFHLATSWSNISALRGHFGPKYFRTSSRDVNHLGSELLFHVFRICRYIDKRKSESAGSRTIIGNDSSNRPPRFVASFPHSVNIEWILPPHGGQTQESTPRPYSPRRRRNHVDNGRSDDIEHGTRDYSSPKPLRVEASGGKGFPFSPREIHGYIVYTIYIYETRFF